MTSSLKKKYYVYVIELDSTVADIKKFRKKNPKYFMNNPCVYVGQSSRKPDVRFEQHKEGYKSNRYAKKFGLKLRPDLYKKYNPIIYTQKNVKSFVSNLSILDLLFNMGPDSKKLVTKS